MAELKEIIEIEQSREKNNDMHLFAEGTFWRAYEKSAWLCVRCIKDFKVNKREFKKSHGDRCQTRMVFPEGDVSVITGGHACGVYLRLPQ